MQRRLVQPIHLPETVPAVIDTVMPELRMVDPRTLHVDERYQRGLSERSMRLIRKIVAEWSWNAYKPPVVVEVDGQLEVLDGQHTAIAAASHGGIDIMPVMVVRAEQETQRAGAFVRHNRDRIQVTALQIHNALVKAGDDDALTVAQVCDRAGIKLLRNPPAMGRFQPGDTLAVGAIVSLVRKRFAKGAREVLEVCGKTNAAPVSADMIKAVELLMFDPEYKGEIDGERICVVLASKRDTIEKEAARFAAERKIPKWRTMASVIFMNRKRLRNA